MIKLSQNKIKTGAIIMYKVKNHSQVKIKDLSVYMEIYNENQTVYRVTSAPTTDTSTNMVYGVEVENFKTSEIA